MTVFLRDRALRQTEVQIAWQAWHFDFDNAGADVLQILLARTCKLAQRIRGRRIFKRSGAYFMAGAALLQVRYEFGGRRITFARSGADFPAAGAALSEH